MAESKRERIVANWLTTMKTISIANGYNNDLDLVERFKLPVMDQQANKILQIKVGEESAGEGDIQRGTRFLTIHTLLQVRHDSNDDGKSTETIVNSIEQDIYKAVNVDRNRGANAQDTRWLGTSEIEIDEGGAQAGKVLSYQVVYDHDFGDESL